MSGLAADVAHRRVLNCSDERDVQLRLRLAAWSDGWNACLDVFADHIGGRVYPARPTEPEILRYGPGGREHAGDPRPGDYLGAGGGGAG